MHTVPSPASTAQPLPPGPRGHYVRNTMKRIQDALSFFLSLHRDYGSIVRYNVLHLKFCIIFDPELTYEVLAKQRAAFGRGFLYSKLDGRLIRSDGAEYRKYRTIVQPFFHRKMLDSYATAMIESIDAVQDQWHTGQTIDTEQEMYRMFHNIVSAIFCGHHSPVNLEMVRALENLAVLDLRLSLLPARAVLRRVLPRHRQLRRIREQADSRIAAAIRDAKAATDGQRVDLVSFLVHSKDEEGTRAFSDQDVLEVVEEMMVASHATSSTSLAWLFYNLSQNPSVREKLEREVDEVMGNDRPVTQENYDRLRYTRAVVDESLRLTNPLYFIGRTAQEDCMIGPYLIPAGTHVQLCSYIAHRDARYFPEPERFLPERWLQPQPERPRYAYMPFGAGHRSCIGEGLALMGMVYTVARLVQRWRLETISDQPPALDTLIAYQPRHGVPMQVTAR